MQAHLGIFRKIQISEIKYNKKWYMITSKFLEKFMWRSGKIYNFYSCVVWTKYQNRYLKVQFILFLHLISVREVRISSPQSSHFREAAEMKENCWQSLMYYSVLKLFIKKFCWWEIIKLFELIIWLFCRLNF